MKHISPLQFAREQCANMAAHEVCAVRDNVGIGPDGRLTKPPRCFLATPGKRCAYFDKCVLPLARALDRYKAPADTYNDAIQATQRPHKAPGRPANGSGVKKRPTLRTPVYDAQIV